MTDAKPLTDEEIERMRENVTTFDERYFPPGDWLVVQRFLATIDALRAENARLKECRKLTRVALDSVPVMNSLRTHRNQYFQMQGAYDGAMGDECKELCRQQFNAIDSLIRELEKQ